MTEFFRPQLALRRQRDGAFVMRSITLAPSGSYGRGPAVEVEQVPGAAASPHERIVLLHLSYQPECHSQLLSPVRHILGDLELNPSSGKTGIAAAVVVCGCIVGRGRISSREALGIGGPIETHDWYAWLESSASRPDRIRVIGTVEAPAPGYGAWLVLACDADVPPSTLVLELHTAPPGRLFPALITQIPIGFDMEIREHRSSVLIRISEDEEIVLAISRA